MIERTVETPEKAQLPTTEWPADDEVDSHYNPSIPEEHDAPFGGGGSSTMGGVLWVG